MFSIVLIEVSLKPTKKSGVSTRARKKNSTLLFHSFIVTFFFGVFFVCFARAMTSLHALTCLLQVTMKNGEMFTGRCDTPYGHWRHPLTREDLERKFLTNTKELPYVAQQGIISIVNSMDTTAPATDLYKMLKA